MIMIIILTIRWWGCSLEWKLTRRSGIPMSPGCFLLYHLCIVFVCLFVFAQSPHRQLPTHMLPRCCISQKVAHVLDIPNAERLPFSHLAIFLKSCSRYPQRWEVSNWIWWHLMVVLNFWFVTGTLLPTSCWKGLWKFKMKTKLNLKTDFWSHHFFFKQINFIM